MPSFSKLLALGLLSQAGLQTATAYPWMAGEGLQIPKREEKRQLGGLLNPITETLGNTLEGLAGPGGLLEGLLGSLGAATVRSEDKRPDAAHPFQASFASAAPGPSDQRGPCPGLNTLANHGYLPRNGIVTAGQVIEATAEGFNMATELSTLLAVLAITFGGNLPTETFSLGGEDDRTYSSSGIGNKEFGRQYGLDGHSRCEGDISATRRDYYTNNGDNHNAYPDRFKRLIELAKQNGGKFDVDTLNKFYGQNAQLSINDNPRLYFQAYTIVVILGEYPFIPNFFSNGTYGAGGNANYESVAPFLGMQADSSGTICYVPERFPENWYRRSYPYGVVQLVANLLPTYLTGPRLTLPNPLGILQNPAQAPQIGCAIYQGITSGIPAALLGESNEFISEATKYLQRRLLPTIPSVYGCNPSQPVLQEDGEGGGQYESPTGDQSQQYNICA